LIVASVALGSLRMAVEFGSIGVDGWLRHGEQGVTRNQDADASSALANARPGDSLI
jgi:hypothetical protein